VVHCIVNAHQGAIAVDSRLGEGTTFRIWLPLVDAPATAAVPRAPRVLRRLGHGEKVVFVDDDEPMRLMVQRLLEVKGFEPRCFDSAEAALAAFEADPDTGDVVVTDFNMPGLDGLDLARALSTISPGLPVIISSGYIDESLVEDAKQAGVSAVLHKESLLDTLGPELQRVLQPASANAVAANSD
jgi:FixJ family two-component response regulator